MSASSPQRGSIILAQPGQAVTGSAVAVAVDVIRFCSTAVELTARLGQIHIGPSDPAAISRWRSLNPGGLVFAEDKGRPSAEADYDNSPDQAARAELNQGPVLLASDKGAPLSLSLPAGRCWLAGLTNFSATAGLIRELTQSKNLPVLLFPASPGFEDDWCARALRKLALEPEISVLELLGDGEKVYHHLKENSLREEADLRICAQVDRHHFTVRLEAKIDLNYGLISADNPTTAS